LPAAPISPNRTRNIALTAFLGLLVGAAAALCWDYYRGPPTCSIALNLSWPNRVRSKEGTHFVTASLLCIKLCW
jgi:hypothetical protein